MKSKNQKIQIICVDEGLELTRRLRGLFADTSEVWGEPNIDRVLDRFETQPYDVLVITGAAAKAGPADSIELLEVISSSSPSTQIIFLAEQHEVEMAMSALKVGTYQYVKRPATDEELRLVVATALENRPSYAENLLIKKGADTVEFEEMIGRSEPMQGLYRLVRQAAATDMPVLLIGETGTGKDMAAQAIHRQSSRSTGPFVPVQLGALPTELIPSELFGHEKGAFVGANERRLGSLELANGGTVFFDKIATIEEKVQIALLRLIEEKAFRRIGGETIVSTDVRLMAATHKKPDLLIREGALRADLVHRLNAFPIFLPPLRTHREDILLLTGVFVNRYARKYGKNIRAISPQCQELLESYDWPGNVRELKNVIQRAVLICEKQVLGSEHLTKRFRHHHPIWPEVRLRVGSTLSQMESEMLEQTLKAVGNNRTRAAEILGISRRALYDKLKKYKLS